MQFAAMFAHDAQNYGQTKTGADAGRLGSEKGIKDARLNGLGNPRTVVADFQQHALFCDAPGLHADNAASALRFDGMPRIANQVHQDLLKLPGSPLTNGSTGSRSSSTRIFSAAELKR